MNPIQETDQAILKITFLISALDGVIDEDEKNMLHRTAAYLPGYSPEDTECQDMIQQIFQQAKQLAAKRDASTNTEMVQAMLAEIKDDYDLLRQSFPAAKKAFAIWIAMAKADHKYDDTERELIKTLQKLYAATEQQEAGPSQQAITDEFLDEVERKIDLLNELEQHLKDCPDDRKAILTQNYETILNALQELILTQN